MSALALSTLPAGVRLLGSDPAGADVHVGDELAYMRAPQRAKALPLRVGGANLGEILPDGGLPRGAVVELAAARALGRATSLALAACAAAQAEARLRSGDSSTVGAWCAFVDPWSTLHAPAVVRAGVDSARLLVVRPPLESLARVAVRIAQSRAFGMIVIDTAGVPGAELATSAQGGAVSSVRLDRWVNIVRRLALAVERTDTSVVLLTDAGAPRPMPLPVAMRIELARELPSDASEAASEGRWFVRVAKERHGRVGMAIAIAG